MLLKILFSRESVAEWLQRQCEQSFLNDENSLSQSPTGCKALAASVTAGLKVPFPRTKESIVLSVKKVVKKHVLKTVK